MHRDGATPHQTYTRTQSVPQNHKCNQMLSPYATSVRSVLISLFLLFPRPRCAVSPSASTNSWPRRRCRRRFLPYVHAANARIAYATYAILSAPHRTRMPLFSPLLIMPFPPISLP